jgi:hypothetical protein
MVANPSGAHGRIIDEPMNRNHRSVVDAQAGNRKKSLS